MACIFEAGGGIVCFGLASLAAAAVVVAAGGGGTPHATVPPRFGLMLVGAMGLKLASGEDVILS